MCLTAGLEAFSGCERSSQLETNSLGRSEVVRVEVQVVRAEGYTLLIYILRTMK